MISTKSLNVERGGISVIRSLDFRWEKGEKIVMIGPNGAGKTTLALTIAGMQDYSSGEVTIDSKSIKEYSLHDLRKKVGIVFQDPETQFITTDVEREISFGLCNIYDDRDRILKRVEEIINYLELGDLLGRDPAELSGGEKQLVAIASIYAMSPEYIIFDEVTSYLDRKTAEKVYSLWKKSSSSLLVITQDFEEIVMGDRILLLEDGKMNFDYSVEELMEKEVIPTSAMKFKKLLEENRNYIPGYERIMELIF